MEARRNIPQARHLRREMSEAERCLWRQLRAREFAGWKFRRQHSLGTYIVDFVCLEARLVIEADGGQHVERQEKDEERTRFLESMRFRVLRFWNHEILTMREAVRENIWIALQHGHPHPDPLPPAGEGEKQGRN